MSSRSLGRLDLPVPEISAAHWAQRADLAEAALFSRHIRPLWALPTTELGVVGWPPRWRERLFFPWHYWWQAQLLDCAVDAAVRTATPVRRKRVTSLVRTHRLRNLTGWTTAYFDDMAWLAIALQRATSLPGVFSAPRGRGRLLARLSEACEKQPTGGIPWRTGSDYYNTPANGPAGIALLRMGLPARAVTLAEWLDKTLRDPATGLICDGIDISSGRVNRQCYTYCQGVVLGLETELAMATGDSVHTERVHRLLVAVEEHLTRDGVIIGGSGGDGGLFNGILARYLAVVALSLPGSGEQASGDRRRAARIVAESAAAAWANRLDVEGEPLFGHDWSRRAQLPRAASAATQAASGGSVLASAVPERDLSVQLSGWMLLEAAHRVAAAG